MFQEFRFGCHSTSILFESIHCFLRVGVDSFVAADHVDRALVLLDFVGLLIVAFDFHLIWFKKRREREREKNIVEYI